MNRGRAAEAGTWRRLSRFAHRGSRGKVRTPRNNAGMDDVTTNDDWTDRQQAQAAGFDAIGTRYDEVFPHKEGQTRTVEQLLERLRTGARVLDLGCGTGVPTARQLVDGGCQVTGVDISPVMLDQSRRKYLRRHSCSATSSMSPRRMIASMPW